MAHSREGCKQPVAEEASRDFGQVSKCKLAEKVLGYIDLHTVGEAGDRDADMRTVGLVVVDSQSLVEELVGLGVDIRCSPVAAVVVCSSSPDTEVGQGDNPLRHHSPDMRTL